MMQAHPDFDLLLHTTAALETALGERIVAREPLHLWPLSSVETLTTAGGRRFVYKVQREPTVEPEFFARAVTDLLPACTVLQRDERQAASLLPLLTAPTLRDAALDTLEAVARGREIVREIGAIRGDVPVYRDLGTAPAWRAFVAETVGMLGAFPNVAPDEIAALVRWTESRDVLATVEETSQLIHGDLKAEHVFRTDRGYTIIDWQRPCRAPAEIDLALLLESLNIPTGPYVAPAARGIRWFLLLHWAAEAKTHLLPHLPFFHLWARQAIDEIGRSYDQP